MGKPTSSGRTRIGREIASVGEGNKEDGEPLAVKSDGKGRIWSHVRKIWLVESPEERVRQAFLCLLVNEYGYKLEQVKEEESVTGRGSGQARADFIVWRTLEDKLNDRPPLIIVECKSDRVSIKPEDYHQGDHYARMANATFFVTHNTRETRFWRVRRDRMPGYIEEIDNIPHASASDKEIEDLIARLKTFKEDEFAELLHQCHNVIRNREHLDPAAAFDEIAKILFIKVWVERELASKRRRKNLFDTDFLDEQIGDDPLNDLFERTKRAFREDAIFAEDERVNLKATTSREIVRLLQRYNLSATSEDVKGIAFERFLGRTFRGEIGQFFTPRSIVEFMIRMVDPREGETICDPASGSGGFLIRFFEIVREQILGDVDRQYQRFVGEVSRKRVSDTKRAELLRQRFEALQETIDPRREGSRLWMLANRRIYGCDANERMARTSKMNMIMHGDGHGGVHHHNGFINVDGIFDGRFDIVLTNPPFGANVEPTDRITESDLRTNREQHRRYVESYGTTYREAYARVERAAAQKEPIGSLFDLPYRNVEQPNRRRLGKIKTEILFLERCLRLLKPGGRVGVVLPEGIFNNPSLRYVREFCEDRARILAVVSLPQETFYSAGASVKASLLFMQRFTEAERKRYSRERESARKEVDRKYEQEIREVTTRLQGEVDGARAMKDGAKRKAAAAELAAYERRMTEGKEREARELLRARFSYPIFLYDAQHVGITSTGEPDANELYANAWMPEDMTEADTCLEAYRRFHRDPEAFARGGD